MRLTFRPVQLGAGSVDRDARLVFDDEALVAIVSRLSALHDEDEGKWFLEIGFGQLADEIVPLFHTFEEACGWIVENLQAAPPV